MRDEHRLRRPEVRKGRHQRVAGRLPPAPPGRRRRLRSRAGAAECGAAGTAADRAKPARCANVPYAADGRRRRSARRAGARRSCGHPHRRPTTKAGSDVRLLEQCRERRFDLTALPRRSGRRPCASARAHARLPVTSSSNRRRSKRNEAPKSNAAASGAASKRPDHKLVISRQSQSQSSVVSRLLSREQSCVRVGRPLHPRRHTSPAESVRRTLPDDLLLNGVRLCVEGVPGAA